MTVLTYEPLTEPVLTCEKAFKVSRISSRDQLQKYYDQISINRRAIGHVIALGEEQILLLTKDEPIEKPTIIKHLLEDLHYELGKLNDRTPSTLVVKMAQRLVNKYAKIIEAIEALPETSQDEIREDIVSEKLSC